MPPESVLDPSDAGLILSMRGIGKSFPGVRALDGVDLELVRGAVHAICGENGAGKSTLMKILSGVYPHGSYDGEIELDGRPVAFTGITDSEAAGVAIIHQELALIGHLSVAENIYLGHERARRGVVDHRATLAGAAELLRRVGLAVDPRTRVADLGVGGQQLVEIAKALAKDVRLLILDEPTAALNDTDSQHLLDLVRGMRADGITAVLISHKLGEVTAIADAVTVLRDGRSVETLHRDVAASPGGTDGGGGDGGSSGIDEDRIIRGMVGRALAERFPPRDAELGGVALQVRGWTVRHPVDVTRTVVDDVSLTVRHGEVVGLAGLMGSGRTELAMSVFGRSYGRYVSGSVAVDGREVRTRTVPEAIAAGLAYVSEDRKQLGLHLGDDIARNTTLAAPGKVTRRGVYDEHAETVAAERFRRAMRIRTPSVRALVATLSGGNQQKVALAKWIFTDPRVLILDEPTRGVDVGAKYEIYTVINDLAAQGRAVLVISSELPELLGLCDRIYTIADGRVTAEVDRAAATQETLMRAMTRHRTTPGATT